jgi:hypothetical protein
VAQARALDAGTICPDHRDLPNDVRVSALDSTSVLLLKVRADGSRSAISGAEPAASRAGRGLARRPAAP